MLNGNAIEYITDHNQSIAVDGDIYHPNVVFELSAIEYKIGIEPTNAELTMSLESRPFLRSKFLRSGTLHLLTFEVKFHEIFNNVTQKMGVFFASEAKFGANQVSFSLRSELAKLETLALNKKITLNCSNAFGDRYCKVNRLTYGISYAIAGVTIANPYQFLMPSLPTIAQFQNNGYAYLQLSAEFYNATLDVPYRTFTTVNTYELLQLAVPCYLQSNDIISITVTPGCSKTLADCTFYNNVNRFDGFLKVKGKSEALNVPIKV